MSVMAKKKTTKKRAAKFKRPRVTTDFRGVLVRIDPKLIEWYNARAIQWGMSREALMRQALEGFQQGVSKAMDKPDSTEGQLFRDHLNELRDAIEQGLRQVLGPTHLRREEPPFTPDR